MSAGILMEAWPRSADAFAIEAAAEAAADAAEQQHAQNTPCNIHAGECDGQGPHACCFEMAELRQKKAALEDLTTFANLQITPLAAELVARLAQLPKTEAKLAAAKEDLAGKVAKLDEHIEAGGCIDRRVYQTKMYEYIAEHRGEQMSSFDLNNRAATAAMVAAKEAATPENCAPKNCAYTAAVDRVKSLICFIETDLDYMRTSAYDKYTERLQADFETNLKEYRRRLAAKGGGRVEM